MVCVTHLDSRIMLEVSINGEVKRDIKEEMSEMGSKHPLFFFFFFKIVIPYFRLFCPGLT